MSERRAELVPAIPSVSRLDRRSNHRNHRNGADRKMFIGSGSATDGGIVPKILR